MAHVELKLRDTDLGRALAPVPMRMPVPAPMSAGVVVHVVGRLTEVVFGFVGPATHALASSGARQVVIVIDDARARELLARVDPRVEVLFAHDDGGPLRRWLQLHRLARGVINYRPLAAVHLHGFLPSLLGAFMARRTGGVSAQLYFSPHASRTLVGKLRFIAAPIVRLVQPFSGVSAQLTIANAGPDAKCLSEITGEHVDIVESPVDEAFFTVERREARRPLLFSSGHAGSDASVDLFAQLAVLLGDFGPHLSFNWIGQTETGARQRLNAANVSVFGAGDESERASRLAGGWVYVAIGGERGFPAPLAEAMAAGLPCVALATAAQSDLIDDGVNGFLCSERHTVLQRVAELIDNAELRDAMGRAARAEARRRFSVDAFSRNLLAAYHRE